MGPGSDPGPFFIVQIIVQAPGKINYKIYKKRLDTMWTQS